MTARQALTHPWRTVRVQIALGAIFVVAAGIASSHRRVGGATLKPPLLH